MPMALSHYLRCAEHGDYRPIVASTLAPYANLNRHLTVLGRRLRTAQQLMRKVEADLLEIRLLIGEQDDDRIGVWHLQIKGTEAGVAAVMEPQAMPLRLTEEPAVTVAQVRKP